MYSGPAKGWPVQVFYHITTRLTKPLDTSKLPAIVTLVTN